MNIKNHRNTRNSLPSLMLCWSLWVQWLHIFSNSWKRAWLKHTAWASQQSTQNTAARTHIISVWCENWCPKHHHTICLAFYFPAILLHRVDMQRYVSWCPVTTLTALLSSRDIPHPQKKEGGRARGGVHSPEGAHAPCSHWLLVLVMMLSRLGRALCRDRRCLCWLLSSAQGSVWSLSGVCLAGTDIQCKGREGSPSSADSRPVGPKKAKAPRAPHQEYPDVLSELCSTLHCRKNGTEFRRTYMDQIF